MYVVKASLHIFWDVMCVCVCVCVCVQETDDDISSEVDLMMSSDIVVASLSTKHVTFSRLRSGWLFREDRTVGIFALLSLFITVTELLYRIVTEFSGKSQTTAQINTRKLCYLKDDHAICAI